MGVLEESPKWALHAEEGVARLTQLPTKLEHHVGKIEGSLSESLNEIEKHKKCHPIQSAGMNHRLHGGTAEAILVSGIHALAFLCVCA